MSTQIDVSTDELLVQISADRSPLNLVLYVGWILFLFTQGVLFARNIEAKLHIRSEDWLHHVAIICSSVLGVLLFLWVAMQCLRSAFGSQQSLRGTRIGLELTSTDFGRVGQKKSFARESVRSIAFGPVVTTKYGSIKGLTFQVQRSEIKTLRGLKAVEAQQVLAELRRLGFDTVIDPAMKMLIEIEQSLIK